MWSKKLLCLIKLVRPAVARIEAWTWNMCLSVSVAASERLLESCACEIVLTLTPQQATSSTVVHTEEVSRESTTPVSQLAFTVTVGSIHSKFHRNVCQYYGNRYATVFTYRNTQSVSSIKRWTIFRWIVGTSYFAELLNFHILMYECGSKPITVFLKSVFLTTSERLSQHAHAATICSILFCSYSRIRRSAAKCTLHRYAALVSVFISLTQCDRHNLRFLCPANFCRKGPKSSLKIIRQLNWGAAWSTCLHIWLLQVKLSPTPIGLRIVTILLLYSLLPRDKALQLMATYEIELSSCATPFAAGRNAIRNLSFSSSIVITSPVSYSNWKKNGRHRHMILKFFIRFGRNKALYTLK